MKKINLSVHRSLLLLYDHRLIHFSVCLIMQNLKLQYQISDKSHYLFKTTWSRHLFFFKQIVKQKYFYILCYRKTFMKEK